MDNGTVVSAKHTQLIIHLHLCLRKKMALLDHLMISTRRTKKISRCLASCPHPDLAVHQQLIPALTLRNMGELTTMAVITLINQQLLGELQQHGCT
jgi:hypothetical protein